MKEWLAQYWPHGLGAAFASVLGWGIKRAVHTVDDHGKRIGVLETKTVTRAELDDKVEELRGSLTASINQGTDVIREDVRELRTHLLGGGKP